MIVHLKDGRSIRTIHNIVFDHFTPIPMVKVAESYQDNTGKKQLKYYVVKSCEVLRIEPDASA